MAETSITLTRRELYERVWAVPLHRLCKEFGLSDRGLAKICARHKIPVPARGVWAKKAHGKPARQPPLPPGPSGSDDTIITISQSPPPDSDSTPRRQPDPPEIVDARMGIDAAIGQLDANRHLPVRVARFENLALVFEHIPFACLKEDIDRILADDRCKLSGRGLNEVALGESGQPDPSFDG